MTKQKQKVAPKNREGLSPETIELMEVVRGIEETLALERARGWKFIDKGRREPVIRLSPLDSLRRSGRITREEWQAGELYGRIYKMAHFNGKYTCGLSRFDDNISIRLGPFALHALIRAQKAVYEPRAVVAIDRTCGCDLPPNNFSALHSGLLVLQKHYLSGRAAERKIAA
jgi:hypothetical protein